MTRSAIHRVMNRAAVIQLGNRFMDVLWALDIVDELLWVDLYDLPTFLRKP